MARPPVFALGLDHDLQLFPTSSLYPLYLANPRRPQFNLMMMNVSSTEIPETGSNWIGLRLGGRYGILRVQPAGAPDRGVQLEIEASFLAYFDTAYSLDNIGWDGFYGLLLSWRASDRLAFRLATLHDSSHVGDEYAERTGRLRIGYTREEFALGAAYDLNENWRGYGEVGWAYDLRNKALMDRWRLQLGLEYESGPTLAGGMAGWYAGIDNVLWEERDWQSSTTIQGGVEMRLEELGRRYRLGFELYNGRSLIGEFFQHDQRHLSFGLWLDL